MQNFFVNLPLSYIARDRWYLNQFITQGLAPELGLDTAVMSCVDAAWHREVAAALDAAGLPCSIHLPFFDLQPGSIDDYILKSTRRRLASVRGIIEIYKPRHLVGHAGFTELYEEFYGQWLSRARETWSLFMDGWPGHPPLFLENVYEKNTQPLVDLFAAIAGRNTGLCFDTGHWLSFSGGEKSGTVSSWITQLAGSIRHLHLHDNDGSGDQHLGLGQGLFPWDQLFAALADCRVRPTITLEPHTAEDLEHSLKFIEKHPSWFAG